MLDALKDLLWSLVWAAFSGFDDMVETASDTLKNGLDAWNTVLGYADVLEPFCLIIVGICLMMELANVASKVDIIKWEHGLKLAVKMVLAKVCLDVAPDFLKACYLQAQSWIGSLATTNPSFGANMAKEIEDAIWEIEGFGAILGMFLSCFVLVMAIKICGLIVQVIAIGRIFEIYVYLAVSPLPFAFLPLGTGDGVGISRITSKFIKNFVAVCLQGVMMIIVMQVFGAVMDGAISDLIDGVDITKNEGITDMMYIMLLASIALVMSVIKSGSWAKSVIDAM